MIRRLRVITALFTAVTLVFAVRLTELQLIKGEHYAAIAEGRRSTILTAPAARGAILDSNGVPLARDRAGFAVVLDGARLPRRELNTIVLNITKHLIAAGDTWYDNLPLSDSAPWRFTDVAASVCRRLSLSNTATAETVLNTCIERYALSTYTVAEQRRLAGIRYTMEMRGYNATTPYTLATDVSRETVAIIQSHPAQFPGVQIQTASVREYPAGTTAAHLIGTVGLITAEEYRESDGYRVTDTIGKSGIEAALERTLRGTAGTQTVVWGADGTVAEVRDTAAATAGDTVQLTINSTLQNTAQSVLEDTIIALRAQTPTEEHPYIGQDVRSGSAVLLDVKTGGILVAASAPGYDLSTYADTVNDLLHDADQPLFNRALYGTFPCGSVIKPAVAVAGLAENIIREDTELITCDGVYHHYETVGFSPKCLGKHGEVMLPHALQRSCNIYFFELGRLLGIDRLNQYLTAFGLGQPTGIELGEANGILASPATKNGAWFGGDTCQCAIGQMDQRFTPLQLASYAMTLANRGVRYRTHLTQRVLRYDGTVLSEYTPEVLSTVEADASVFDAVERGMQAVVQAGGTAYATFRDAPYTVAAKTGTAQNGSARSDHGIFIGYAPIDQPQVAIAVVMENGTSTPAVAVARTLLDAYFGLK